MTTTPTGNPPLTATATWVGVWGSRRLEARVTSGHAIILDSAHTSAMGEVMETAGASPMEALLVALAGCLAMSALPMMRKARLDVTGYELRVTGQRSSETPVVFTAIAVEHVVEGRALTAEAVAAAIELGETRYCGVSAMLRQSVPITHTVLIQEADARDSADA